MSWELAFSLGALALAATIAYGWVQSRRAGRAVDAVGEAGARAVYDSPGTDRSPDTGRRGGVPPLVWIIAGLLIAWMAVAGVMSMRTSGGATYTEPDGASVMPATPPTAEAPGTPANTGP